MGDAVAAPRGDMPLWNNGGAEGVPGQNPNNTANPPNPGQSVPTTSPQPTQGTNQTGGSGNTTTPR